MNDYIAESIKKYQERFVNNGLPPTAEEMESFLKQELEAIAEKTREERLKDLLSILPRKFFEDEDHIVGGYISKKDLYELLSDKESK